MEASIILLKDNMNMVIKRILFLLAMLLMVFSCTDNESENPGKSYAGLEVSTDFIKLLDDSTNVAGNLDISANTSQVYLRWNVPAGCNLDTTLSVIQMSKGKATLPIKWSKALNSGNWGPADMAYEGGVVVSTEKESKYIRLFWVEELDTAAVLANPILMTRADGDLPKAVEINLHPDANVVMNQQTGGAVTVEFTGVMSVRVDASDVSSDTHVDLTDVPLVMHESGDVFFPWTTEGAPNFNFVKAVRFLATSYIYKDAMLNYRVPGTTAYYKFVKSIPESGGELSAQNAAVTVVVNTNKEWSLDSEFNALPPTEDPNAFGPEDKTLKMYISDNENSQPREVKIYVKSQGVNKDTLTFIQLGSTSQSDTFEFIKTVPAEGSTLPATGTGVDVTVRTDQNWYINSNVSTTTNYEVAGGVATVTKTYNIPANTSNENRNITLTIGADNTGTAKTVYFIQSGAGTTPENPLHFVSVLLPNKLPATESTYTFNFEGDYTGELRIRSKSGSQVLYTDNSYMYPGTQPQGRVPANTGEEREVIFEYDKNDGVWLPLPEETKRLQEGKGGGESPSNVTLGNIIPYGDIPERGGNYYCIASNGPGKVQLRAMRKNVQIAFAEKDVPNTGNIVVSLAVPSLDDDQNTTVTFEYSLDNGATWQTKETRNQEGSSSYIVISYTGPSSLPAMNANGQFLLQGTSTKEYTITAYYGQTIIGSSSGIATPEGTIMNVKVSDNYGPERGITFSWSLDGETYTNTGIIKQAGK